MPGIHSADIKTLTRGSLKKATVKLTANNKQQFDIIDLLYMRLGYTVLLEWGNSIYTTNGEDKEILRNTLIEDMFFNVSKGSYLDMLNPIKKKEKNIKVIMMLY
jgi:N-acetylneuraminic acid mutarotase